MIRRVDIVWRIFEKIEKKLTISFNPKILGKKYFVSITPSPTRENKSNFKIKFSLVAYNLCHENGSDQLIVYRGIDRQCMQCDNKLIQTIFEGRPVCLCKTLNSNKSNSNILFKSLVFVPFFKNPLPNNHIIYILFFLSIEILEQLFYQ